MLKMAIIENWIPPTRENWETLLFVWKFFPILPSVQWLTPWYPMGKTSYPSIFNVPGRLAWFLMEIPGVSILLYNMSTLPAKHGIDDLPWQNKVLAGLFAIHYSYRAVMYPLMAPSMAPMNIVVASSAVFFQVMNGTCLGAWLAAYGPTTQEEWRAQLGAGGTLQFVVGISIFYLGLAANYYHDDELREIRRREERRRERVARDEGVRPETVERHYAIPQAGFFKFVLYPHYFLEWCEWFGYWMACGWSCTPAFLFLFNEFVSMLPRAVNGRKWYEERFGPEKIKGRKAVIPGLL